MKISILITMVAATFIFSGCTSSFFNLNDELDNNTKDDIVVYEQQKTDNIITENQIINGQIKKKSINSFSRSDIIVGDPTAVDYPPRELMEDVDSAEFYNKRLGDIIRILTSNLEKTSVIYEPNVDPSLIINMRTGKMKLFHLIKQISENAGYYAYYDSSKRALIISQYQTMKYLIPSGIFVDKQVSVSLGNTNGSSSGSIDLNSKNISETFASGLDNIGSKNKIVNFDKDTGMLFIKEHPTYIDEITNYVVDFVQDRSRKFLVEMAIIDVVMNSNKNRSFDLGAMLKSGSSIFNITSLTGSASGGFVLQGGKNSSATSDVSVQTPISNGVNFDMVVNLLNSKNNSQIVERAKSVVSNHSLKYIGNMITTKYISDVESVTNDSGVIQNQTKKDDSENGIQFIARIDAFSAKDYIDVSLAPVLKASTLQKSSEVNGISIYDETEQVREMFSTASIRSGDVIVVGGLIRDSVSGSESKNPLFGDFSYAGSKSKESQKVETIFMVKVTEMTETSDSYTIPTSTIKSVIENKM